MTYCRLIAPAWLAETGAKRVIEGLFTDDQIIEHNLSGYNVYTLPNSPSHYEGGAVKGSDIDQFRWCFIDFDLKSNTYPSKEAFIERLKCFALLPTKIVDSGGGVHAYWRVSDLDAKSYLRLSRRLMRLFNTDEAVGQIFQLMRLEGSLNTKKQDAFVMCQILEENAVDYTCEQLDKSLPALSLEDARHCDQHYDKTYGLNQTLTKVTDSLPPKFGALLADNSEVKQLWAGHTDDRSKADYRLGHILLANGFSRDEACTVLMNSAKALQRAPHHRVSYAENIIDKIGLFESQSIDLDLSMSVKEILSRPASELEGTRFPCYKYMDNTEAGFRLGQVLGLVAGSGVGKTAMALNLFMGFVASNPDYVHFFVPLEQPANEIASRWKTMCGENQALHDKVHIISNYGPKGEFRDLSLEAIKAYILKFQEKTGKKAGCVVIDHIGVLHNINKLGQDEGVKHICKAMKGFAIETNTFLIMQSQTSRDKAGIGDLELNKDAAFGTSTFENYVDYLAVLWQPLKRMYSRGAPTVMAYKFCKIRHKNQSVDIINEDVPYSLYFDPKTQLLRGLTQDEETKFKFYLKLATDKRKQDRKTELVEYVPAKHGKMSEAGEQDNARAESPRIIRASEDTKGIH